MPGRTWIVKGATIGLCATEREEFISRWELLNDLELEVMMWASASPRFPRDIALPPVSREQREVMYAGIADRTRVHFDIRMIDDDRFVGEAFLSPFSWPTASAELSVLILDPADRAQGYTREAVPLIGAYAFDVLWLNRLTLRALVFNEGVGTLVEEMAAPLGARVVGVEHEAAFAFGAHRDVILVECLRRDFPPQEATAHLRKPPPERRRS
ncbi:MAG TPA: GNAT family protein [Solirubrobacteraceae bacterium]|nr:GNAT family protein [Solirubrobacteraceae bacterium]